jgi:hypothetical protein
VEEILNQPLPELEHKSWIQSFREAVSEAKEKLETQGIREKMTQKREAFDELIRKVGQQLKKALHTKAEEAIILIQ